MKSKKRSVKKRLTLLTFSLLLACSQATVSAASDASEKSGKTQNSGVDAGKDGTELAFPDSMATFQALAEHIGTTAEELPGSDRITPGDSVADWLIYDSGLLGYTAKAEDWLKKEEAYVSEAYQTQGGLDRIMATEWQRPALAVLSMGGDPTAFGTDKKGQKIDLVKDGTYGWTQTEDLGLQGLNAYIYALNVLDAGKFEVPEDAQYTREDMLLKILENQSDGGFGLEKGMADIDITAMALQTLARYQDSDETFSLESGDTVTIKDSIEEAVEYLAENMSPEGYFVSYGAASSESSSQVMMAMYSLGIDPDKDERFHTEQGSLLSAFCSFMNEDGLFTHVVDGDVDIMATEQAIRAMLSKEFFENGKGSIFDLSQLENMQTQKTEDAEEAADLQNKDQAGNRHSTVFWILLGCMTAAFAVALVIIIKKGGKRNYV